MLVLDGKTLSRELESRLAARVARFKERTGGRIPTLATLLVGDDPASATYVRMKGNACQRIGMNVLPIHLDKSTTTERLLAEIEKLNQNPDVSGILLQHPVPGQIDERRCFDAIAIDKDVDGVTSAGFGLMAMGRPAFGSATPAGIMRLLDHYRIDLAGKHAVVVGRSPILGKPVAMMLLQANATVTICHSRTVALQAIVGQADIVVGALGRPEFIRGAWIKDGAVVIDAGYHPVSGGGGVGDIELGAVKGRAAAYTPVPGGVGPMTIVTLLGQTVEAAEIHAGLAV
jgi:methylenetetrahydrofolate dehydrogenase (NADP+)/methenyltetrahydrofolate cyclohydrolase